MARKHLWRYLLPSGPNGTWLDSDVKDGQACWVCKAVKNHAGRIVRYGGSGSHCPGYRTYEEASAEAAAE